MGGALIYCLGFVLEDPLNQFIELGKGRFIPLLEAAVVEQQTADLDWLESLGLSCRMVQQAETELGRKFHFLGEAVDPIFYLVLLRNLVSVGHDNNSIYIFLQCRPALLVLEVSREIIELYCDGELLTF